MKLLRYRVTNFRSVNDSGWIECNDVTTLVGVNEAGKSNLLLALWKLNPASAGEIDGLHDMPVSKLSEFRNKPKEIQFINAEFLIDEESSKYISENVKCVCKANTTVQIQRFYDGHREFIFPNGKPENLKIETDENTEETETEKVVTEYNDKQLLDALVHEIPKFVYYSNYGNLSSKIYLPHVIKWLNKETVQGIDVNEDQVRTLKVLFDFVNLNPTEVLELGKDPKIVAMENRRSYGYSDCNPTKEEIQKAQDSKEKRSILLQSASGKLTKQFKDWWRQGEYKFRFEADGDYFRIWVSDEKRPEEVGLELRSTGLQWFLSFYLIFLVESKGHHKNTILLLDEAGLTLHPLAQKDLAQFFNGLSKENQIIHTTHSPFLIDTSNVDRCRVVYVDNDGFTVASSDLRQGNDSLNQKSIYAVHAAMGLCVSDILLQGCQPIIVEGPSDQHYLNAIKIYLINKGLIAPKQELIFIPCGGVKGVPGITSILGSKNDEMPFVLLDSDRSGVDAKKKLLSGLYKETPKKILSVGDYVKIENSEIEDIIPLSLLSKGIGRLFNKVEDNNFEDEYDASLPLIPQIEKFATDNDVVLSSGWKVELAKAGKQALLFSKKLSITQEVQDIWVKIFKDFMIK